MDLSPFALTGIDAALGSNDAKTRETVATSLRNAEAHNVAFVNWYNSTQQRERLFQIRPRMTAASIDVLAEAIEFAGKVYDAYTQLTAEQREAFRNSLKQCEWKKWQNISAVDPSQ